MRRKRFPGNPMAHSTSLIYKAFSLAMVGTTFKKIKKLCRKVGSTGEQRLIKILRSGEHYGRTWHYEERDGSIKVSNIQFKKE